MNKAEIYIESLDEIFNGDKLLIYKACNSFLKHVDYYLNLMKCAYEEDNRIEIQRITHSFKTTLHMFGDKRAIQIAKELEDEIKYNKNMQYKYIFTDFIEAIKSAQNTSKYIIDTMKIK